MKKLYVLMLVVLLVFVSCSKTKEIRASGKVLKVIVLVPLSKKDKKLGVQSLSGLKVAKKMQKYLKNGDEIVFDIINTDEKMFMKTFKESVLKDKPYLVISFLSSDDILAIKDELKKYHLPVISTLATNNNISDKKNCFVQVCIDNHKQSLVAAHYIRDEKFMKHVGIIYDRSSIYSTELAKEFRDIFKSLNGEIDFFFDIKDKDTLKDINASDTEIIFNSIDSTMTTKIMKMLKNKQWHVEMLSTDGLYSENLQANKKDIGLYNGTYVIEYFSHDIYKNKQRKLFEKLLAKDGYKESSFAFVAYDGYKLVAYAFETCPDYNKECIEAVLQDSETIEGISGNFSMIDGKARREVYVDKIEDGMLKKEVIIY